MKTRLKLIIDGKEYPARFSLLLHGYLIDNCKRLAEDQYLGRTEVQIKESLVPLIPIGLAIVGGGAITWYIATREQIEKIKSDFLE